jgi:hypothetical protein
MLSIHDDLDNCFRQALRKNITLYCLFGLVRAINTHWRVNEGRIINKSK